MSYMAYTRLYRQQDKILRKIFDIEKDLFPGARVILVGGTALARCYLQHRASYDLDFFVNARFDPVVVQRRLSNARVKLQMVETVNTPMFAAALHGMADVDGEPLRISIGEAIYADMFPVKTAGAKPHE